MDPTAPATAPSDAQATTTAEPAEKSHPSFEPPLDDIPTSNIAEQSSLAATQSAPSNNTIPRIALKPPADQIPASAAGSNMSANERPPINPAAGGSTDQIGRPSRPWSLSPPPGSRQPQAFSVPGREISSRATGAEGEIGDMQGGGGGGLSAPNAGYEGRRHSIASGEVVQGHHNGHSHTTANARAGPPSNSAHLLSPYHDQYSVTQAPYQRQALKRKLSHDQLPSGNSPASGNTQGAFAEASEIDPARIGTQLDSRSDANPSSQHPNKRRSSAIDIGRLPQMSGKDLDNSANTSPTSGPATNLWQGGPPRWGSGPYSSASAGGQPPPPPSHIADERRDSAASIFSATSMASSTSAGGGYAPSTAPTSYSSNGGPEDPNRNYQSFVWPPAGGPPPPHAYPNAAGQYYSQPPNTQFPAGPGESGPASSDERQQPPPMGANDNTPPPGTTTPDNSTHGQETGNPTPTSPSAPSTGQKETPYSRSPELRVSHKLAERKRRKEMKDLFDELRDQLPADRGMKASKWEILSKAVEYIASMKNVIKEQARELEHLRHEADIMRNAVPGGPGAPPPGAHMHGAPPPHILSIPPPPHTFYRPPPPGVFATRTTPPRDREGEEERQ